MSSRSIAASSFWTLLSSKVAQQALRLHYGGFASIFMLHRIVPEKDLSALDRNRALEITPDQLDELIAWVKAKGYSIVSLRNIIDRLGTKPRGKQCAFTFDDGYRDNLTHALPVFEKYNAPFTLFLTTDFIDRKLPPWWYALEDSPITNESFEKLLPRVLEEPSRAEHELKAFGISLPDLKALAEHIFLDWDEVRSLADHPLLEVGGHTVSHRRLSALEPPDLWHEVKGCKTRIEQEIGRTVDFFAYPFGDAPSCKVREFQIAEKSGYLASVTTRVGNVFSGHRNFLHCLPRIPIEGIEFSIENVALAVSGFPLLRQHKLRPMVVQ